ncbi:MAG: CinA family protein [Anaerolineales bacterium]
MRGPASGDVVEVVLEVLVGEALRQRGWKLAVGESCSGGLVAYRITTVPGSSDYFLGGVVAYSNEAKTQLLGVTPATLEQYGAVSPQTASEMARGARRAFSAEVGVAITGIAGPGGATLDKPIGLTLIAVNTPQGEWVERFVFVGDRTSNQRASAQAALELLRRALKSED